MRKGFVLAELLVVIAILIIIAAITLAGFRTFQKQITLDDGTETIIGDLQILQNKTLASIDENSYGAHFETNQYVLFTGGTYNPASPDNEIKTLDPDLEIYDINLAGGAQDIIFNRLNGRTEQYGDVGIRLVSDASKSKNIYIKPSGQVGLTDQPVPVNSRLIDSRHVHLYYPSINPSSDRLIVSFGDPVSEQETIIINDNLDVGNQLYWRATVEVDGEDQVIEIRTHQMDAAGTIFSVIRDRRFNNKISRIDLQSDNSGYLVRYDVDGGTNTVGLKSINVSDPEYQ